MLINLSNHPSAIWPAEQTAEANCLYGEIVDIPFPQVDPQANEYEIAELAQKYVNKVQEIAAGQAVTVHLMGEMTLTFAILSRLRILDIPCVASTTQRVVKELEIGRKEVLFQFVKFRKYE